MSNLILLLLLISYLLLIPFQIETPKGTGDQNVGLLITFYIFIAFAVLSLLLTILITFSGGFNWISNATLWRNIGIGILWIGMISGIFLCMYMKAEIGIGNKSTGLVRLLAYLFYYGGLWLPLLMLISYYSMINPEWRFALSPNLHKSFLLLCTSIGFITLAAKTPIKKLISANSDEYNFNLGLAEIDKAKTIEEQFWLTTKITDDSLLTIVLNRIKNQSNLEDELITILMKDNQFIFFKIYEYIYDNPIEHPERLIEPINLNLNKVKFLIEGVAMAPWKSGVDEFEHANIEAILKIMYKYFGNNRDLFRANMVLIKQTLDAAKERNGGNEKAPEFMSTLNKYKTDVQNWLDGK